MAVLQNNTSSFMSPDGCLCCLGQYTPGEQAGLWLFFWGGTGPPPPHDQSDHRWTKRNSKQGKSDQAIFGHNFLGPRPPPPPTPALSIPLGQGSAPCALAVRPGSVPPRLCQTVSVQGCAATPAPPRAWCHPGARWLLGLIPLTTNCRTEAPWGGGGSWHPKTRGVAPPPPGGCHRSGPHRSPAPRQSPCPSGARRSARAQMSRSGRSARAPGLRHRGPNPPRTRAGGTK